MVAARRGDRPARCDFKKHQVMGSSRACAQRPLDSAMPYTASPFQNSKTAPAVQRQGWGSRSAAPAPSAAAGIWRMRHRRGPLQRTEVPAGVAGCRTDRPHHHSRNARVVDDTCPACSCVSCIDLFLGPAFAIFLRIPRTRRIQVSSADTNMSASHLVGARNGAPADGSHNGIPVVGADLD